jgi:hypothetical protein
MKERGHLEDKGVDWMLEKLDGRHGVDSSGS